jgi:Gametolysin peptidase M11/NPCBM-associated, NEW3 domain of alpha-galactosidase
MLNTFTGPGVVRALACFVAVVAFDAATASLSLAQAPASDPAAFAAAWQSGTPITVTGELTVIYADDFANHRAERRYSVRDQQSGLTFQVRFEKPPAHLQTGTVVRITGRANGTDVYVLAGTMDPSGSMTAATTAELLAEPATSLTGDQRTLVMMVNFNDATLSCAAGTINNTMFADPSGQSVNGLYRDTSRGQISFSGNVVGPYTINYSVTMCDPDAWSKAAETAATAAGVDVASYPHRVYVMPEGYCAAAGLGSVGGNPSHAWIFTCGTKGVYAHELGHNLGLDHAASALNGVVNEFGDGSDPMAMSGNGLLGLNAAHRHQLGWASPQVITQSGTYSVAPLEPDPIVGAPQVYIIQKPDTNEYYYLSTRFALKYDTVLQPYYVNALSVHRYTGRVLPSIADATKTFLVTELADGQSFTDSANGITVTQVSHDSTRSTARVDFTAPCIAATPSFSISPQTQSAVAGSTVSYAVSLTNHDGAACAPSTFALSTAAPPGWAGTLSAPSLTLGPGASGQATLTVTSASSTSSATYSVTAKATDAATAAHTIAGGVTYTVPDTVPPSTPSGLTAGVNSKLKQIQLSWSPATDNVAVGGYRVLKNGTLVATSTTASWIDSAYVGGSTYSYSVVAFDAAGNSSAASSSVAVTLSGGNKR